MSSQAKADSSVRKIVFLGDSLTEGFGVEAENSFPSLIGERVAQANLPFQVVNAGLSGDTSAGGVRRIQWLLRSKIDVLVLALGANDGLRGLSLTATEENLAKIIASVRRKHPEVRVVIAGMLIPPNMGKEYSTAFREVFPRVAKNHKAELIPFLLEGVAGEPELNLPDGIHPNKEGYRIVTENVWQVLMPVLKSF